jgi:hypothetical protein
VVKILSFMMIQPPSPALNILLQFNPSFSTFQFSPWSKKNPSNQSRELGLNPSRGKILCLHVRYSNRNILSFWYRNQAIQKPKFIYASRTTTLMKESKWDKIFLKNRIWQQSSWSKRFFIWQCRASKSDWESALRTMIPRT